MLSVGLKFNVSERDKTTLVLLLEPAICHVGAREKKEKKKKLPNVLFGTTIRVLKQESRKFIA